MTSFIDGPAAGVALVLERAPLLLRVVRTPAGKWDALDQLGDEPHASESVFVYRRSSEITTMFVDYQEGGRCRGAVCASAEYRVLPEQPEDVVVRSTAAWRAWCDGPGREALRTALGVAKP